MLSGTYDTVVDEYLVVLQLVTTFTCYANCDINFKRGIHVIIII